MKTETGTTYLSRTSDGEGFEKDKDFYKGNEEARALGADARKHELGEKIWTKYLEEKEKSSEGHEGIPNGSTRFLFQDILLTVPLGEWASAGVRAEDIRLLEASVNDGLDTDVKEAYAGQLDFLNGVFAVVIALSTRIMSEEECKAKVEELRDQVKGLLGEEN